MKRYFFLQCKRVLRYLPGAFLVAVLLLGGLGGVLGMTMNSQAQKEENNRFSIGVVGSLDDPLLQLGLEAIGTYDSSQLSLELTPMDEDQAKKQLNKGALSAYLVLPDGFMDSAMAGELKPIRFVCPAGAAGMTAIMQREVTDAISRFMTDAQKGVYGMYWAADDQGLNMDRADALVVRYTDFVLLRDKVYQVENLGIGDGLDLGSYLLCGFLVLLLLVICLPFGPLLIRRDVAMGKVLAGRGRSAFLQTLCDYLSFCIGLAVMVLLTGLLALCVPGLQSFGELLLQAIPVAVLAAAISYFLYCLATDLIGGLLLQFFVTLCMCFVSGCLYPVHFFPSTVQLVANWLPTGVARQLLSGSLTGSFPWGSLLALLGYSAVFFLAGSFVTVRRIREVAR